MNEEKKRKPGFYWCPHVRHSFRQPPGDVLYYDGRNWFMYLLWLEDWVHIVKWFGEPFAEGATRLRGW